MSEWGDEIESSEFRYTAAFAGLLARVFHAYEHYAIITLGGKQYRVREGERLLVDRLHDDEGKTFEPRVLLVGGDGKTDLSPTTTVTARIVGHGSARRSGSASTRSGPATRSTTATAAG